MNLESNIPEILKRLQEIRDELSNPSSELANKIGAAMYASLQAGMALMKRRIIQRSEDAEGNSLGTYEGRETRLTRQKLSIKQDDEDDEKERKKLKRLVNKKVKEDPDEEYTEYEKLRLIHGLQINRKDLQFSGSLQKSIDVVTDDNYSLRIAITNPTNAKIARYQEQQIGNIQAESNPRYGTAEPAKIFILSEAEFNQVSTEGNRLIADILKERFK